MMQSTPDTWNDLVDLVELSPHAHTDTFAIALRRAQAQRSRNQAIRFLLIVVLPTLLAIGYFGFIASDRYLSEARFVVRQASALAPAASQGLSADAGKKAMGGSDDSNLVQDYMRSRDAVRLLVDKAGLRQALARGHGDPFWVFPRPMGGATDEDLFRAYPSYVDVDFAASTGVTTLQVMAFDREDASRIASVLIDGAEARLNALQDRAHADALRIAEDEVDRNRSLARQAEDRLTAFRTRESVIDPTLLGETGLTTIGSLALEEADTAARLDVTMQASPRNPQIAPMRARIRALQAQIDHERMVLAGNDASLAPKVAEYERLLLEQDFADRSFVLALNMREMAHLDALREQSYLERVVDPRAADKSCYPRRGLWIGCVLLVGLAIFWMFRPTGPATPPEYDWA